MPGIQHPGVAGRIIGIGRVNRDPGTKAIKEAFWIARILNPFEVDYPIKVLYAALNCFLEVSREHLQETIGYAGFCFRRDYLS
ncbi:hypothetical protein FTO68_00740 [Methanocalculus taiwanensis]|uniref:Uncharacterized protein n=1 Tax=Methanocalculus taiwanensis TaxID=106207 RepID=A0ABD4TES7_9EURY|nr:hypothetical protein [Methanocalculus taiwanensis]MCQ1537522.1 hypothetical protein [Methanocalculus taiwanensis]